MRPRLRWPRAAGGGTARSDGSSPGTVALVTAVAILAAWTLAMSPSGMVRTSIGFWLAACLVSEWLWVKLPLGGATVSMASSANFAALLTLPQGQAMAVAAASTWLADLLLRKKPPIRAVFNASQTMLSVAAGAIVFRQIAGPLDPAVAGNVRVLPALAASAFAYWVVNTGTVALAIGCAGGTSPFRVWRESFGRDTDLIASGATLSLGGMIAMLHALVGSWVTVLVVLPLLIAYDSYRRRFPKAPVEESEEAEAKAA